MTHVAQMNRVRKYDRKIQMNAKPRIRPLDVSSNIYALQDEDGNTIGTGTREVCEMLLFLITQCESHSEKIIIPIQGRANVRSAITV